MDAIERFLSIGADDAGGAALPGVVFGAPGDAAADVAGLEVPDLEALLATYHHADTGYTGYGGFTARSCGSGGYAPSGSLPVCTAAPALLPHGPPMAAAAGTMPYPPCATSAAAGGSACWIVPPGTAACHGHPGMLMAPASAGLAHGCYGPVGGGYTPNAAAPLAYGYPPAMPAAPPPMPPIALLAPGGVQRPGAPAAPAGGVLLPPVVTLPKPPVGPGASPSISTDTTATASGDGVGAAAAVAHTAPPPGAGSASPRAAPPAAEMAPGGGAATAGQQPAEAAVVAAPKRRRSASEATGPAATPAATTTVTTSVRNASGGGGTTTDSDASADSGSDAEGAAGGSRAPKRKRTAGGGTSRGGGGGAPVRPKLVQPTDAQLAAAARRRAPSVDWRSISDPEERTRQRRLAKNRATAARSRERRRTEWAEMAARMDDLEAENEALLARAAAAEAEVASLTKKLAAAAGGGGGREAASPFRGAAAAPPPAGNAPAAAPPAAGESPRGSTGAPGSPAVMSRPTEPAVLSWVSIAILRLMVCALIAGGDKGLTACGEIKVKGHQLAAAAAALHVAAAVGPCPAPLPRHGPDPAGLYAVASTSGGHGWSRGAAQRGWRRIKAAAGRCRPQQMAVAALAAAVKGV